MFLTSMASRWCRIKNVWCDMDFGNYCWSL